MLILTIGRKPLSPYSSIGCSQCAHLESYAQPALCAVRPISVRYPLAPSLRPLAVPSKGYIAMLLQGMLQEQQQRCPISELQNIVSHHLVLYDIGTVLPRNRSHSLPATASSFSQAMPGDVQQLCDRNELDSSFC